MAATIALVDDDKNILASVSIAIQAEGYVTRIYSDPQAALDALVETPPDLAVLDVKMPGMDGLELLRRIREKREFPVIFLTSKDDELDEALGLAMGADDYITKPFSQRLLLARIKAILRRVDYLQRAAEAPDDGAAGAFPLATLRISVRSPRDDLARTGLVVLCQISSFNPEILMFHRRRALTQTRARVRRARS